MSETPPSAKVFDAVVALRSNMNLSLYVNDEICDFTSYIWFSWRFKVVLRDRYDKI